MEAYSELHIDKGSALYELIKENIFKMIICIMGEKDMYTKNHCLSVAERCREFGRFLGLKNKEIELLVESAFIHDIGKVGVSEVILNKIGELDSSEYEAIKKHPEISSKIIKKSTVLADVSYIVLCHHERWDGKGYPNGLKGTEIPKLSRILSIVDSFDAMTQDRQYRKALTDREAFQELEANKWSQFDGDLVDRFISFVNTNHFF